MNCKELGYRVGDEFEVIEDSLRFNVGDVVVLHRDDNDCAPAFRKHGEDDWHYLNLKKVKPLEKTMDIKEAYKVMAQNCGIKVGDTVKVLREAETDEMGWDDSWNSSMNHTIGRECKVLSITAKGDFSLDDGMLRYNYPFYVLEKIKDGVEPIELKDYTVQFKEGGTIEVGDQTIDFETVKKIYDRAKSTL